MNQDETSIAIMGESVPARHEELPIEELNFLPDNPRVYATIREMSDFSDLTSAEKQVRIYERLLSEPSVKNLIPEIRRDGGLQEPIIVRWDTRQVIEGNSRLAAYRKLNEEDSNSRWTKIRCLVVTGLSGNQQTRLLGQAHLNGRTEWSPYAKALYCFRWVVEEQQEISTLSNLIGVTPNIIKKNIDTIQAMQDNNDKTLSNFSYYDVLVRNRAISAELKKNKPLRDTLFSQIKTPSFTAQQLREYLPVIIAKPKILKKYEKGEITLEEACDRARTSSIEQQLKKIRDRLDDIKKGDLNSLDRQQANALKQVIKQTSKHLKRVSDMVDAKLEDTFSNL